jgi:hypothetical protein
MRRLPNAALALIELIFPPMSRSVPRCSKPALVSSNALI